MSGWFAMKRGVHEHPLFHKQPERLFVWTWIVASAAWKDTRQDANGKTVIVKRGQLLTSYRQISNATGVGVQVIRTLLDRLRDESAVDIDTNTGRMLLTVRNYDKYQTAKADANTADNTRATQQQHTKEQGNKGTIPLPSEEDASASSDPLPVSMLSKAVWDLGKRYLSREEFGIKDPGKMIGKWLRDHDAAAVLAAIDAAHKAGTHDPISYIAATLRPATSMDAVFAKILRES